MYNKKCSCGLDLTPENSVSCSSEWDGERILWVTCSECKSTGIVKQEPVAQPNSLLVMILKGLTKDTDEQSMREANLITALQFGDITWDQFKEHWHKKAA